jgi:hypothetical protein
MCNQSEHEPVISLWSFVASYILASQIDMELPVSSTTGAAVFWLYILAALALTTAAIYTIASIKIDRTKVIDLAHTRYETKVFTTWAILSFVTISYNMVQVLLESYEIWPGSTSYPPLRFDDPIGAITNLWAWSTTSTPFQSFGQAVAGDDFGWLWAQSALLKTFSVALYIAYEGGKFLRRVYCLLRRRSNNWRAQVRESEFQMFGSFSAWCRYYLYHLRSTYSIWLRSACLKNLTIPWSPSRNR